MDAQYAQSRSSSLQSETKYEIFLWYNLTTNLSVTFIIGSDFLCIGQIIAVLILHKSTRAFPITVLKSVRQADWLMPRDITWYKLNSLAPGIFEWNFRHVISKRILVIDGWGISCEIVLIWMSLDFTDDQTTLVQVMAWCRQATSHYLSQCWPRSLSPHGVTRPHWVNYQFCELTSLWRDEVQLDIPPV